MWFLRDILFFLFFSFRVTVTNILAFYLCLKLELLFGLVYYITFLKKVAGVMDRS